MAKAAPILDPRRLNRATLARQLLLGRARLPVAQALSRLFALQAQWPRPPFLALWSRLEAFARAQLLDPLHARTIVRAPLLRGTLHLVTAGDYLSLRPACAELLARGMQTVLRGRLEGIDVDQVTDEARAFFGKGAFTFEEVRDHLQGRHPKADQRAMGHVVRTQLPLVQVPEESLPWGFPTQPRFAQGEAWLGKKLGRGATPADIIERYLAAYGPATVADMQAWTGLAGLQAVVAAMDLRAFHDQQGRALHDLPEAPRPDGDVPAPPRFLPDFDSAIVARADERFVARQHRPKVFLSALRIAPTFLIDGFVAGTWSIQAKRATATLTLHPFGALTRKDREALAAEATALLAFIEPGARPVLDGF
jgi:hypothetical protein